jgi:hypothetical protein
MPNEIKIKVAGSAHPIFPGDGRDPEDRYVAPNDEFAIRDKMLDKTLADSYPASDPPSSIPDPSSDSLCTNEWCEQKDCERAA